jgi:hypothetical protein
MFIRSFAEMILPTLRAAGYANAEVDLSGNRAIKLMFKSRVDFGDLGEVDPYVDLIVSLDRRDGPGIWIPNRKRNGGDAAHPQKHTELMTDRDPQELVVHRAHLIRLGKRAIKRDGQAPRVPAMCSWNFSALGLEHVSERAPLAGALAALLADASTSIAAGLTEDPAKVAEPIALPSGVTNPQSAERLAQSWNSRSASRRACRSASLTSSHRFSLNGLLPAPRAQFITWPSRWTTPRPHGHGWRRSACRRSSRRRWVETEVNFA